MQQLLVICGPTATGKTALGIEVAKKYNGQLISADSRQVYREMDIGTGKDKPKDRTIWLYDVADPIEDFNVNTYHRLATQAVHDSVKAGMLPIIVGGTGFYIKSFLHPPATINLPINPKLRSALNKLPTIVLQEKVKKLDPVKWATMNNSDRQNPRRLVRAIEVSQSPYQPPIPNPQPLNYVMIGLTAPQELLNERIQQRIESRLNQGFEAEVKKLLVKYPKFSDYQSSHTPGYRQWIQYLQGACSKETAIKEWYYDEIQYAKRQMTWFAKEKNIEWFDITSEGWYANIQLWLNSHITSKYP